MGALETVKELATLVKKAGDIELYQKIVELQGDLVALSSRNFELEKKCQELQTELDTRRKLKHERLLYFFDGDSVPYCPWCYESSGKLIHLFGPIDMHNPEMEGWECHVCNHDFTGKNDESFHPRLDTRRAQRAAGRMM